ncbi:MAG: flagellar hook-length control protein FliK, partial [Desulfobacterales bacterium]|nr:flagellar hook-length control protein FliK [Desulfobacterales bacterium]
MAAITINGVSINPALEAGKAALVSLTTTDSSTSNYIIIQVTGPLDRARKDELSGLGVEILEYAPHNAYICRFEPFDLDPIRKLGYVEWANVYMTGFKIAPKLRASAGGPRASLLALSSVETSMAREPVDVVAALHQNAPMEKTLAKIAAAARLDASALRCASDSVRLTIQPQYLEKLAEIDEIRHIEESFTPKLLNNVAIGILGADAT